MIDFFDDLLDLINYWLDRSMKFWLFILAIIIVYNFIITKGV